MLSKSREEPWVFFGFALAFSRHGQQVGAPRRSTPYPFMGVIPVSEGNAEAQRSQRDAEGERGKF